MEYQSITGSNCCSGNPAQIFYSQESKTMAKAKKAAKKVSAKKTDAKAGYKGHRAGTIKEKLHVIFDKYGKSDPEKAKAEAKKIKGCAPATINTSFSQFRNA